MVSSTRSLLALLLLCSAAGLAQGEGKDPHAGHSHDHDHDEGPRARPLEVGEKNLEKLPAQEQKRVKALAVALDKAASAAKNKQKAALDRLEQSGRAARKRAYASTKRFYESPAFVKAAPRMAQATTASVPAELASSTLPWLKDACDPDGAPSLEHRFALCAQAWEHEASAHPADWRAHALWRDANAAVHQDDAAFMAAWLITELRPKDAAVWYRAAELGLLAKAPREATGAAYRAMALEVDEVFLAAFAESLARTGAVPPAVQLLENALAKRPRSGRLLAMQALLMAAGGRADLALPVIERAKRTGYEGVELYLAWGHALFQQKKLDDALAKFRAAVALDPGARDEVPAELRSQL